MLQRFDGKTMRCMVAPAIVEDKSVSKNYYINNTPQTAAAIKIFKIRFVRVLCRKGICPVPCADYMTSARIRYSHT